MTPLPFYSMIQEHIHELIREANTLEHNINRDVATKLLCCVLEIAKWDSSEALEVVSSDGIHSGYFDEKITKALERFGYRLEAIK